MQAYIGLIGACSARQKQTGNKSVRKIIINNTINLGLLFKTAISILVVSNHNGFRVLFDETGLLPCILFEKHIYISASEMASHREPAAPCQLFPADFRSLRESCTRDAVRRL